MCVFFPPPAGAVVLVVSPVAHGGPHASTAHRAVRATLAVVVGAFHGQLHAAVLLERQRGTATWEAALETPDTAAVGPGQEQRASASPSCIPPPAPETRPVGSEGHAKHTKASGDCHVVVLSLLTCSVHMTGSRKERRESHTYMSQ